MSLNLTRVDDDSQYQDAPPGLGHNSGVTNWAELLDLDGLRMSLQIEHETFIAQKAKLAKAFANFRRDHAANPERDPDGIAFVLKTDADKELAIDLGGQFKAFAKKVEAKRVEVKAPFFEADKAVQQFFRGIGEPLEKAAKLLEATISTLDEERVRAARALADAEAKRKREEANQVADAAMKTGNADLLDSAIIAEKEAGNAEKLASAPVADFSRARGSVAMSSAREVFSYTITNFALIPDEYKTIFDSKVKEDINRKINRVTEIPGLEITSSLKTQIRS